MRLQRAGAGNRTRQMLVERAYREKHGTDKAHHEIAVELYDQMPTQRYVQEEIQKQYGQKIGRKTASVWINKGLAERQALAA